MTAIAATENDRLVVGVVKVEQEVTREFIDDTLCTALDAGYGSSLYWIETLAATEEAGVRYPYESISRGGSMMIKRVEGDGYAYLTLDKYLNGLALWANHPDGRLPSQVEDYVADAIEADAILQLALFGEIVYG